MHNISDNHCILLIIKVNAGNSLFDAYTRSSVYVNSNLLYSTSI